MNPNHFVPVFLLTVCLGYFSLAARTVAAEPQTLWGQRVQSLTTLDDHNLVSRVEVSLPFAVLLRASREPASIRLSLPEEVRQQTSLGRVAMMWAFQGHGSDSPPQFELQFLDGSATNCNDSRPSGPQVIADLWTLPLPGGLLAEQPCSLHLAFHGAPPDEVGDYHSLRVSGFVPGKANFSEPVFNKNLLEAKQNFDLLVPLPQYLSRSLLYPRKLVVNYQPSTDSYTFALTDFVWLTPWRLH